MGNFEKLGILVIIVLVVVILVLAVWGMDIPPNEQASNRDGTLNSLNQSKGSGEGEETRDPVDLTDPAGDGKKESRKIWPDDFDGKKGEEPKVTPDPDDKGQGADDSDDPVVEPDVKPADLKHVIVKGDNFNRLAEKYYGNSKYWAAIRDANPTVNPSRMQLGVELVIPHPDTVLKKATARKRASTPRPNAEPPSGRTYTVRKGETLSAIALHVLGSKNAWRKLYEANRAKIGPDPDRVSEGMVLVVP
jgi:nucleoid-associated protein YgaU